MNQTKILSSIPIDPQTGSISFPIYQTATFVQEAPGVHKGFDYGRTNNPTRQAAEKLIASLENGFGGLAFATGLAAIDAVLKLLSTGDEIIAVNDIYGGAFRLFAHVYAKFGIKVHYVDTTDADNIIEHLNTHTKLIWIETPTNPTLKITDIRKIAQLKSDPNILIVVDNTFASPLYQRPLELGADIVVHSATKYLAGHSDLLAGLLVVKEQHLFDQLKFIQNASGGILSPQDSWLLVRGIETLSIRYRRQSESALQIALFLEDHPQVAEVYYPGLPWHKNHEVAKTQQQGCYGGVLSFSLKNNSQEDAVVFCQKARLFHLAESLGGVKSLICIPSEMTHKSIPREKRVAAGISDSLIRISCGIEEVQDLIADLEATFSYISEHSSVAKHY